MGRPKKEKPNHATGMYEVKVTVGHTFDGKPVRKSFYSSVAKLPQKPRLKNIKLIKLLQNIREKLLWEKKNVLIHGQKKCLIILKVLSKIVHII